MPRIAFICAVVLALAACRDGDPTPFDAGAALEDAGPSGCEADFGGDYVEHAVIDGSCAVLDRQASDAGATWRLHLHAHSFTAGVDSRFDADLGPSPAPGAFNDGTLASWSALAIVPAGCTFSAGDAAVPQGSFQLALTQVELGQETGQVHGTLRVIESVHAAPGTVCGSSNQETVDLRF